MAADTLGMTSGHTSEPAEENRTELSQLQPVDIGTLAVSCFQSLSGNASRPAIAAAKRQSMSAFNLVLIPAAGDAPEVDCLAADNEATYERLRARGGALCPDCVCHEAMAARSQVEIVQPLNSDGTNKTNPGQ